MGHVDNMWRSVSNFYIYYFLQHKKWGCGKLALGHRWTYSLFSIGKPVLGQERPHSFLLDLNSKQQAAGSMQQAAGSKQQTAAGRQQKNIRQRTAGIRQQTADSRQQTVYSTSDIRRQTTDWCLLPAVCCLLSHVRRLMPDVWDLAFSSYS